MFGSFFAVRRINIIRRLKCTAIKLFAVLDGYLFINDCKMLCVNTLKYAEYLNIFVAVF